MSVSHSGGKGFLTRADLKAVIESMKGVSPERAEILMQELDIGQAEQIQRFQILHFSFFLSFFLSHKLMLSLPCGLQLEMFW